MTRTTITLTEQADRLVRQSMRERGLSFKDAVNEAIVAGLRPVQTHTSVKTPTFHLGSARVDLDRALAIASELEDEALLQKQALGK